MRKETLSTLVVLFALLSFWEPPSARGDEVTMFYRGLSMRVAADTIAIKVYRKSLDTSNNYVIGVAIGDGKILTTRQNIERLTTSHKSREFILESLAHDSGSSRGQIKTSSGEFQILSTSSDVTPHLLTYNSLDRQMPPCISTDALPLGTEVYEIGPFGSSITAGQIIGTTTAGHLLTNMHKVINGEGAPVYNMKGELLGVEVEGRSTPEGRGNVVVSRLSVLNGLVSSIMEKKNQCHVMAAPELPPPPRPKECVIMDYIPIRHGLDRQWVFNRIHVSCEMKDVDPETYYNNLPGFDKSCDLQAFYRSILSSAAWEEAFRIKRETGILVSPVQDVAEDAERKQQSLMMALEALSERLPTLLLVYGQPPNDEAEKEATTCVWLLGPKGILAKGETDKISPGLIDDLASSLLTDASMRQSRPRAEDQTCPIDRTTSNLADTTQAIETRRTSLIAVNQSLARVAQAVFPPEIRETLAARGSNERLLIAPIEELGELPFAALPLIGDRVVDHFSVVILPGLASLERLAPDEEADSRQIHDSGGVSMEEDKALVVGDPDLTWDTELCWSHLPFANQEAQTAAKLAQVEPLLAKAANWDTVIARIMADQSRLGFIYFATHGVTDPDNPADGSYLALTSRYLRGRDLRHFDFSRHPTVVLSACETAKGKIFKGGVYGLARQWYQTGASQVVAGMWDVDDSANDKLMSAMLKSFDYSHRNAEFALRKAMLDISKYLSDPRFWASMSVFGDPSR